TQTGNFAAAFGAGAGIAFLAIPVMRRWFSQRQMGPAGLLCMGLGIAELVVAQTPWWASPGLATAGFGMTIALTSLSAEVQERVPDRLRGRIMALWTVGFLGSRPIAAALNGTIADRVSVDAALLTAAALMLLATWLCRPSALAAPPPTTS